MLRSIVLGNSYFPTRFSESEVEVLAEFPSLDIRHFQLQWNDISYCETRKYEFPSPMKRSKSPLALSTSFLDRTFVERHNAVASDEL